MDRQAYDYKEHGSQRLAAGSHGQKRLRRAPGGAFRSGVRGEVDPREDAQQTIAQRGEPPLTCQCADRPVQLPTTACTFRTFH
eukprot:6833356-Alexandrium_andersonii.AAC.1